MSIRTDPNGRLYLSSDLRDRYGERFHVVEYADRIELVPIDEEPLRAVREEIGDALEGSSVADLEAAAHDRAKRAAEADLGRANGAAEDPAE